MKKNLTIIFFSILFYSFNMYSQEDIPSYFKPGTLDLTNVPLLGININNKQQKNLEVNQINITTISQVGLYNITDISQSQQTSQVVKQVGNKNYYSFNDLYNGTNISFNVLQQGDSNSLQIYGSNSIMDGMKIVQKSNFKNIVIKNYK